ncbi:CinA family protein [Salinibacterium sp. ZJ77]|uniref:CinA family protein n=1 Tax=Salinibacterium sp. ZJ77 TaxID=2708337 RepID=UPI001421BDF8|nr:CinA family protein [Salinibacterium sp. ZJ77]
MSPRPLAARIVEELTRRDERLAVAESLTGGLLTSAIVDVPGASAVLLGGVVAYASPVKASLLGVDAQIIAERGVIDAEVARQMARGAATRLAVDGRPAEYALATTGVAGPDPQDGHPAGTVWIGLATPTGERAHELAASGDRPAIRAAAVDAALELLAEELGIGARE